MCTTCKTQLPCKGIFCWHLEDSNKRKGNMDADFGGPVGSVSCTKRATVRPKEHADPFSLRYYRKLYIGPPPKDTMLMVLWALWLAINLGIWYPSIQSMSLEWGAQQRKNHWILIASAFNLSLLGKDNDFLSNNFNTSPALLFEVLWAYLQEQMCLGPSTTFMTGPSLLSCRWKAVGPARWTTYKRTSPNLSKIAWVSWQEGRLSDQSDVLQWPLTWTSKSSKCPGALKGELIFVNRRLTCEGLDLQGNSRSTIVKACWRRRWFREIARLLQMWSLVMFAHDPVQG